MISRHALSWIGLALLSLAFASIFIKVIEMRVSGGDIYPHYATLRGDPLGCSALFDSFKALDAYTVRQNLTPLTAVKNLDGDTALFLLGLPWDSFESLRARDDSPVIRAVKDEGARLVITLNPKIVPDTYRKKNSEEEDDWLDRRRKLREKIRRERAKKRGKGEKDVKSDNPDQDDQKGDDDEDDEDKLSKEEKKLEEEANATFGVKLAEQIGVDLPDVADFDRPETGWKTRPGKSFDPKGVPTNLPYWHSQYRLKAKDPAWKKAVLIGKAPAVLERRLGKGTVVIATDTYFASNEALHDGGYPAFLLWLTGGKKHLVFDETIHGSIASGGAMKLIRHYRLHGFFLGMFIFIGLWAWRSAVSLTPGDESIDRGLAEGAAVSGEQSNAGFVQLLKRSIPGKDLPSKCVEVWKSNQVRHITKDQEARIASIIAEQKANPRGHGIAETYRSISRELRKRI